MIVQANGLGTLLPCCDPSMSWWTALWSDTCSLCTDATYQAQQAQLAQQGLPSGSIPACDPNAGFFANLLSNECNVSVNQAVNQTLGLNLPSWAYWAGLGLVGLVILKK